MLKSLAFDFGASSGKAILSEFDGKKISLREIHRFSNDPVMFNGTLYWDILRLMNEMKHTLIRCYQEGHQDLASASSDTWGVDFGLLDKNGQLIANPVHYRDKRTDGMQEEAAKYVSDEEFYNSTGIQFMKLNTVYQLLALSKIQKELLDLADTLLFMPDLFNYYLSGVASETINPWFCMKMTFGKIPVLSNLSRIPFLISQERVKPGFT
jgi:rhamnulokinase